MSDQDFDPRRSHLGPPPVDPLSDVAWARVERGLFARLDSATLITPAPPPKRWIWLAAPAFAGVLIAVIVIATRGGGMAPAVAPEPDARVVSSGAPASASFGDAHLTLDANSVIVVRHGASQALLERGAAWFTIGPRGDRPAFVVTAGDATVRVVGTRFRVARHDESVAVHVEHGVVEIQFQGTQVKVGADQTWASDHPGVVATDIAQNDSPATAGTAMAPAVPAVAVTPPKRHTTPHRVAPAPAPVPQTQPTPAVDPDKIEYNRLQALEPRNPDVAIQGYLKLSQGNGLWAANALYAAGRTAFDHHDRRAETLLNIYLQRFPNGKNAEDVRVLLTRLQGSP